MNRIKELYILTAINEYKHSDGDYLCEKPEKLLNEFSIGENDYNQVIELLEKDGVVVYEEKYYEDERTEFSYDGRKIEFEKLEKRIANYRQWCGYRADIDLRSVKALADEIRKFYTDEKLLNAIVTLSQGYYTHMECTLEEILYYYLSAHSEVANAVTGLEALARMFDLKYHDAGTLIKQPEGFFDAIDYHFKDTLEDDKYAFWYERLPAYIKDKKSNPLDTASYYVTRQNGHFTYKGKILDSVTEDADYSLVFSSLFELVPKGGFIDYGKLQSVVKVKIPKAKRMPTDKLRVFIQRNLTDEQNGFLRYAKIENLTSGGQKLIKTIRGKGIEFNNRVA